MVATTPVTQSIYTRTVNGRPVYDLRPDFNPGSDVKKVNDTKEVSDYIAHLRSLGTYTPGSPEGVQFDAQAQADAFQKVLDQYNASHISPNSVMDNAGNFTTQQAADLAPTLPSNLGGNLPANPNINITPSTITTPNQSTPTQITPTQPGQVQSTQNQPGQSQPALTRPGQTQTDIVGGTNLPTTILQPGATGMDVKKLQDFLVSKGLMTPEQVATGPGIYGSQTTAAVAKLQQMLGVDNSSGIGYFGPKTLAALQSKGNIGSSENNIGNNTNNTNIGNDITGGDTTQNPLYQQTKNIMSQLGLQMPDTTQKTPLQTLTDSYTQITSQLGLGDIKSQYDNINKQYAELQDAKLNEINNIQDNPWMTQGIKDSNIRKINDKYSTKEDNLTKRLTLTENLYNQGLAQARDLASQVVNIAHNNQVANTDMFNKIFDAVEKASTAAEWSSPYQNANGDTLQKNNTTGEIRKISSPPGTNNFVISSGVSDAINQGLLSPSEVTRGNLPILNQLYKDHPEFDTNTANANQSALKVLQKQETLTRAFESTARQNLDLANNLSGKVGRTGSPLLNEWQLYTQGKIQGNPDVLAFQTAVKTATNEYAKVITGQTGGAAVSDSARTETEKLLNASYSAKAFNSVINVMKQEMANRLQGFTDSKNALKNNFSNINTRTMEYPIGSGTMYSVDANGNMTKLK